jgi:FMN reductase
MGHNPRILGVGGTTRSGSSTEKALALCLTAAQDAGAQVTLVSGPDLVMPLYSPEAAERTEQARRLLALLRSSDGIVIASPGYHGSLSGLVKNALDYTEDLRGDAQPYLEGRAVGCIACAGGWQAAVATLAALRSIVHALRAWPTPMGAAINTADLAFDGSGGCTDAQVRRQLELIGRQVVEFAAMRIDRRS